MDKFKLFDTLATFFFLADLIFNMLVDEHDLTTEGEWTLNKSLRKQIQGFLIPDLLATIPFPTLFKNILRDQELHLLYSLKVLRIVHGLLLLDYRSYKH